jgi:hypothetical protein
MDFRKIFLCSLCFFCCVGCEKRFEVDIDGNVRSKQFHFEGSVLNIEAYCVSRVFFYITISSEQQYEQQDTMLFYPYSLDIVFKNTKIPYKVYDGNDRSKDISDNPISLKKYKSIVISFHINDPIPFPGDTIILKDMGYLHCKGERINIGDIDIVIKK